MVMVHSVRFDPVLRSPLRRRLLHLMLEEIVGGFGFGRTLLGGEGDEFAFYRPALDGF